MHDLRLRIEKEILSWPNVTTKKMYGCPCYKNKEKLFAFLVTDGVVFTKASEQDKIKLSKADDVVAFFQQGFSCSQAVLSVFAPDFGLDQDMARRISQGFGAGIAYTDDICGALLVRSW